MGSDERIAILPSTIAAKLSLVFPLGIAGFDLPWPPPTLDEFLLLFMSGRKYANSAHAEGMTREQEENCRKLSESLGKVEGLAAAMRMRMTRRMDHALNG